MNRTKDQITHEINQLYGEYGEAQIRAEFIKMKLIELTMEYNQALEFERQNFKHSLNLPKLQKINLPKMFGDTKKE
jgi:hypothetical protein